MIEPEPSHITDMAGHYLRANDLAHAVRTLYANHRLDRGEDGVLLCCKETCLKVDEALRDAPRQITANQITTKWGSVDIVQIDTMPEGTILIMNKGDYEDWEKRAESAYLIKNVGPRP